MGRYVINWDAGYGTSYTIIEANNQDEADIESYLMWKDEAESNADYGAELLSEDNYENVEDEMTDEEKEQFIPEYDD